MNNFFYVIKQTLLFKTVVFAVYLHNKKFKRFNQNKGADCPKCGSMFLETKKTTGSSEMAIFFFFPAPILLNHGVKISPSFSHFLPCHFLPPCRLFKKLFTAYDLQDGIQSFEW